MDFLGVPEKKNQEETLSLCVAEVITAILLHDINWLDLNFPWKYGIHLYLSLSLKIQFFCQETSSYLLGNLINVDGISK